MAKLVFGMNVSLDGFVDHDAFAPGPKLFQHFVDQVAGLAGSIYGRRMYEVMRYFDDEHPEWGAPERAFAQAWCGQHKWVVSRTLTSVGPNATLISDNVEAAVRKLKTELDGEVDVVGPELAYSLSQAGLIDEYRMYVHPVVIGKGKPFFAGPLPRLKLKSAEQMDEDVVKLLYVPG